MQDLAEKNERGEIEIKKIPLLRYYNVFHMLERDLAEQKRAAEQAQELAVEKAVAKMKAEMQEQMSKLRDEKTRLEVQLELLQKKDNKTKA